MKLSNRWIVSILLFTTVGFSSVTHPASMAWSIEAGSSWCLDIYNGDPVSVELPTA